MKFPIYRKMNVPVTTNQLVFIFFALFATPDFSAPLRMISHFLGHPLGKKKSRCRHAVVLDFMPYSINPYTVCQMLFAILNCRNVVAILFQSRQDFLVDVHFIQLNAIQLDSSWKTYPGRLQNRLKDFFLRPTKKSPKSPPKGWLKPQTKSWDKPM